MVYVLGLEMGTLLTGKLSIGLFIFAPCTGIKIEIVFSYKKIWCGHAHDLTILLFYFLKLPSIRKEFKTNI